jgi:hypothetical protein
MANYRIQDIRIALKAAIATLSIANGYKCNYSTAALGWKPPDQMTPTSAKPDVYLWPGSGTADPTGSTMRRYQDTVAYNAAVAWFSATDEDAWEKWDQVLGDFKRLFGTQPHLGLADVDIVWISGYEPIFAESDHDVRGDLCHAHLVISIQYSRPFGDP